MIGLSYERPLASRPRYAWVSTTWVGLDGTDGYFAGMGMGQRLKED